MFFFCSDDLPYRPHPPPPMDADTEADGGAGQRSRDRDWEDGLGGLVHGGGRGTWAEHQGRGGVGNERALILNLK